MKRRKFIAQTATVAASPFVLTQKGGAAKAPASERVRVGMVGAAGRAGSLNRIFAKNKNAEIELLVPCGGVPSLFLKEKWPNTDVF